MANLEDEKLLVAYWCRTAGWHVLELIPHQLPMHPPAGVSNSGNASLLGFGNQLVHSDKNFANEFPFK